MFRPGLRFWLTPFLLATLLCSCASFYRLDVGGDQAEQIRSLFLIVADRNPLGGNDTDAASLIHPDKVGDYLLFAQFDPVEGNPLRWQQVSLDARSDLIQVTLSADLRVATLKIDKSLMEAYSQLTVVAVGHGSEGWYAESVDSGKVRLESGIRLDIGSTRFVRRPLS